MRKLALAILFAITPAAAESRTEPSHQVSFQGITFACGQKSEGSRFMYAVSAARYLPVNEPPSGEPGARSWAVVFRSICDEACSRQTANQHPAMEAAEGALCQEVAGKGGCLRRDEVVRAGTRIGC